MEKESLLYSSKVKTATVVFLVLASVFLAVKTIGSAKEWRMGDKANSPEISVSGKGEAFVVPDVATFSYTVSEEGTTVKDAQDKATPKTNAVLDYLKSHGIAEKDIKTVDYSAQPKYDYSSNKVCTNYGCGAPKIVGYTVSQTIEVKVHDTSKAGEILSGVGAKGVNSVSGLQFTVDNQDAVTAEAREKAIADAKAKADQLAKDLGVHIVRIKTFQENNSGWPIAYETAMYKSADSAVAQSAPALPTGQNKVTSNVTIVFEIR